LEKISFNSLSIDISDCIMEVRQIKENFNHWGVELENFRNGHKLLERQKFKPPADWLNLDLVDGEWNILRQLVHK